MRTDNELLRAALKPTREEKRQARILAQINRQWAQEQQAAKRYPLPKAMQRELDRLRVVEAAARETV